jgi:DNA invertase Pin-like site-specific DNA recombinase
VDDESIVPVARAVLGRRGAWLACGVLGAAWLPLPLVVGVLVCGGSRWRSGYGSVASADQTPCQETTQHAKRFHIQTPRFVVDSALQLHYHATMKRTAKAGDPGVAVAYIRVSTDEQDLGPEAQRAEVEAWARRSGVTVVSWHEDRVSGRTEIHKRRGFLEALEGVRNHGAGLLVVAKRCRIARDVVIAATAGQVTKDSGARLVTADGVANDDGPESGLLRLLMDGFAQYEAARIRARTKAALAVKKARGERISGRAPLGFRFESGRLVEDPQERAVLARVDELRERGWSLARVADSLNREGTPCRGSRWHAVTLGRRERGLRSKVA